MSADRDPLAQRFERERPHLRAVAYRLLGSTAEADDAVQDAWLRLNGADADEIENLGAWLHTVVARVALNMLRSRRTRREEPFGPHIPDPLVDRGDGVDPEHEALLGDEVGLALLVVLETLAPAERLAFVLHDMFSVPFEQIAQILDRSPAAARQLASRARRRVEAEPTRPDAALERQREVVDAFLTASRAGDFDALLAVLDPEVVLRAEMEGRTIEVRGAATVAGQAEMYSRLALDMRPLLVNGAAGIVSYRDGRPFSLGGVIVRGGRIVAIDILSDPARLEALGF